MTLNLYVPKLFDGWKKSPIFEPHLSIFDHLLYDHLPLPGAATSPEEDSNTR